MCGRFTQTKSREEVLEALGDIELPPLFGSGRYNIAPTQKVAVLRAENPRLVEEAVWGFANPHSSTPVINARIETLRERPMFRDLLENNRCLILADGFYEWKDSRPYYFQLADRSLFAFAGLWREAECVIITRAADRSMRGIHHRMPAILTSNHWKNWFKNFQPLEAPPTLFSRAVSTRVNKIINDDVLCIQQADEQIDLGLFPDEE